MTFQRYSFCLLCFKKDRIMEVQRLFALIILKSALTQELQYQGKGSHKLVNNNTNASINFRAKVLFRGLWIDTQITNISKCIKIDNCLLFRKLVNKNTQIHPNYMEKIYVRFNISLTSTWELWIMNHMQNINH